MLYAEYVQQIRYLPFDMKDLEKILNGSPIKKWAYLIHDKDSDDDGNLIEPHLHIEMALNSNQKPVTIASWFSDKSNRIEKAKSQNKKFIYQNMCLYLIHDVPSADGKYKYDPSDVKANFDFVEFIEKARQGIADAKEKKATDIENVLIQIADGKIPRLKIDDYLSSIEQIKYDKKIETAYKIRDRRESVKVDRMIEVMYFYGPSETGKTTWAKEVAKINDMTCCVSGASNDPLQSYIGQECLVLDETRGDNWDLSDLLKLLDNHTASMAKARYHNKLMSDCRLIILTSVQSLDQFFASLNSGSSEQKKQLSRRISTVVKFSEDALEFYEYDSVSGTHVFSRRVPNITKDLITLKERSRTLENMLDFIEGYSPKAAAMGRESLELVKGFGEPLAIAPNDEDLPFGDDESEYEQIGL